MRYLILSAVFGIAAIVVVNVKAPAVDPVPRLSEDPSLFVVDGWDVSPAAVDGRPGVGFLTRDYRNASTASRAQLSITSSPNVKSVYRAGADVPFLGSGYTVEPAPVDLVPSVKDRDAQIARRGNEAWLQLATFGERRGLVGNGIKGWSMAIFDLTLGRPNDYYLIRVLMPADNRQSVAAGVELANTLFPRLVAYYGSVS